MWVPASRRSHLRSPYSSKYRLMCRGSYFSPTATPSAETPVRSQFVFPAEALTLVPALALALALMLALVV